MLAIKKHKTSAKKKNNSENVVTFNSQALKERGHLEFQNLVNILVSLRTSSWLILDASKAMRDVEKQIITKASPCAMFQLKKKTMTKNKEREKIEKHAPSTDSSKLP